MEARKGITLLIDLKNNSMIPLPQFIQNDTNLLDIFIKENGADADLSNITRIVVNYKRPDNTVISRLLSAVGNVLTYQIGLEEMEVSGPGEMEIQFFENENRISTKRFKVNMLPSIGTDTIYENTEQLTVLQELFVEVDTVKVETETARTNADAATTAANTAATNAQQVADENKTRFLPAVATVADRDTAYPAPAHGDTVRVTGEAITYRFDNGSGWVVTDQYNPTAIDEVNVKLADIAINVKNFGAKGDGVTDDTTAIQNAINSATSKIVMIPAGKFLITGTLYLTDGLQLIGSSKKNSVIYANMDATMLKNTGAHSITIQNLKLQNDKGGARTNFDVVLTNNTNPKIIDVELLFPTVTGNAGILIDKLAGGVNEGSTFMPQIVNCWVRNGRIKFMNVTDGKVTGTWVWSHLTDESAIELSGSSNFSITDCDIVPSRYAGIKLTGGGMTHINVSDCFFDGSYSSIYTGFGILSSTNIRGGGIANNKFWNMSEGGIKLDNVRGVTIANNQFRHNNRADNFFDDIVLTNSSYNTITGNTFIGTLARTNKAYMFNDSTSGSHNLFVNNTMEDATHYYHASMVKVSASTIVGLNKPDGIVDNIRYSLATISNTHVDSQKTPGTFYISDGTSSGTPSNRTGILEVIALRGNPNYLMQRLTSFSTATNIISYRELENNTWGSWQSISNNLSGATANRPTAREIGMCYFDITLNKPIWWNGTSWVDSSGTVV